MIFLHRDPARGCLRAAFILPILLSFAGLAYPGLADAADGPLRRAAPSDGSADVLPPKGSGPVRPYRESASALATDAGATLAFTKVPKDQQLIVSTITCFSTIDASSFAYGVLYIGADPVAGMQALIPSSPMRATSDLVAVLTGAYIPLAGGDRPKILIGSLNGAPAYCTMAGTLVPTGD